MAVFPPAPVISALRDVLPAAASLTAPDTWHVTLVFLGQVEPGRVAEILSAVPPPGPIRLRLCGDGAYGPVSWVGVHGDLPALSGFREQIRVALAEGGFRSDPRPFSPHLTVSYHGDEAIRAALGGYSGEEWTVAEFALVSSVDGRYERVLSWPVSVT